MARCVAAGAVAPRLRWLVSTCLSLLLHCAEGAAQSVPEPGEAQPQRPTVGTHAFTMAPGRLEIELGTQVDRVASGTYATALPLLTKVGLAPRTHLEIQTPMVWAPAPGGSGVGDISFGMKWRPLSAAPVVGDLAVLPSVKVPSGSVEASTGTGSTDVALLVISSRTIGPVAFDLNVAHTWRSGDGRRVSQTATMWSASAGGRARGPIGWVAEVYGYPGTTGPSGTRPVVAFLGGPTFTVNDRFVLDAGLVLPVTGPQSRALLAGLVYNVGTLWK